jgi:hypothetical protein
MSSVERHGDSRRASVQPGDLARIEIDLPADLEARAAARVVGAEPVGLGIESPAGEDRVLDAQAIEAAISRASDHALPSFRNRPTWMFTLPADAGMCV